MTTLTSTTVKPCLWFDDNLEEAIDLYTAVFPDAARGHLSRMPDGTALVGEFTLGGVTFQAINGGPTYAGFTEAISFSVTCADQAEVDHFWDALTANGGQESRCGWLKDRFGLSWQIVPQRLYELMSDANPARAGAASEAMMGMAKIVVADLEAAADAAG